MFRIRRHRHSSFNVAALPMVTQRYDVIQGKRGATLVEFWWKGSPKKEKTWRSLSFEQ
jgi:hypothetical protein